MEVKLKPCPFCGADNKPMGAIMRTANRGGVEALVQRLRSFRFCN